jgi:CHAT domain-containing protein
VHIHRGDGGWSWDFEWNADSPTFEGELWRVVYAMVFAEAVDAAASAGVRHLVISPDGSLTAMPHHLLRGPDGERLGDRFLVSYAPNLTGLLTILDADEVSPDEARAIVVEDPTGTVSLARWECQRVADSVGRAAEVVRGAEAAPAHVKGLCAGASILHFTGHATFDWSKPEDAFLRLAGDGRLTLPDLRGLGLKPGALVFLSACDTGRRTISGKRSSSRGIVSAFLEAGAATVVCTLWPVHSIAAALVSAWFYESWIVRGMGRLESLREATRRLREAGRPECEAAVGRRIYLPGERPFQDEYYWGAFVLNGAW